MTIECTLQEELIMKRRKEIRNEEENKNYFIELLKIERHFFKEFKKWLKNTKDPRHQSYITYDPDLILYLLVMKYMTNVPTMRQWTRKLNTEMCIDNVAKMMEKTGLEELPHYDTMNDFLAGLAPEELETIRTYMIKKLLEKRCFEKDRIEGKYWGVIVDGTGLFTFQNKHCDHCLRRVYTDEETGETQTIYMHHVLEAKLVVGKMVFSIATEFIENESEDVDKQDCETKAFYRLAEKIKKTYKRLPICILGDALYASDPVFNICKKHRWTYMIRFKEGRLKQVATEFEALERFEKKEKEKIFWVNNISYKGHEVNIVKYSVERKDQKNQRYVFITDLPVTKKNARKLIEVGRTRWKIENEGFNKQKNLRYEIEHVNSMDYQAMKNHYLLVQIADMIMQLYEHGIKTLKESRKTAKEISSDLLEAIRSQQITEEDTKNLSKPIQVRFT